MSRALSPERALIFLSIIFSSVAAVFWLATLRQPLIDQHEFRQTQTALTALYLQPTVHGLVDYETPVLGSPWSIPFEFPLYQFFVYWIAKIFSLPLDSSGRLLSALLGFLCVFPAKGLMQLFRIKKNGQYCFLALYFSSSIYLYWNRAFMIESMALFLTLSSLYLYVRIRLSSDQGLSLGDKVYSYSLFFAALLLALLVKVTTALPAILLIAADLSVNGILWLPQVSKTSQISKLNLLLCSSCLVVSLVMLKAWLLHSDSLKYMNEIGRGLTSAELAKWNFGTLDQRLGKPLWISVVIERMLTPVGLAPSIFLMVSVTYASLIGRKAFKSEMIFIYSCIFLWLAPLLLFTNLHIVHSYYQSANQVFLLMALAGSFSAVNEMVANSRLRGLSIISVCIFMVGSLVDFSYSSGYLRASLIDSSDKLEAGKFIRGNTLAQSAILVVGDDWSSAFSYHSRRRSLTLPNWQHTYSTPQEALNRSSEWLAGKHLGAIIERANADQQLLKGIVCSPKVERQFGEWKLSICS